MHQAFDTPRSQASSNNNSQQPNFALEDYLYLEEDPGTRRRPRVQQGPLTPDSLGSSGVSPQASSAGSGISSSRKASDLAAAGMYGLDRLYDLHDLRDLHDGDASTDLASLPTTSRDVKEAGRTVTDSLQPPAGPQNRLGGSNSEEFRYVCHARTLKFFKRPVLTMPKLDSPSQAIFVVQAMASIRLLSRPTGRKLEPQDSSRSSRILRTICCRYYKEAISRTRASRLPADKSGLKNWKPSLPKPLPAMAANWANSKNTKRHCWRAWPRPKRHNSFRRRAQRTRRQRPRPHQRSG